MASKADPEGLGEAAGQPALYRGWKYHGVDDAWPVCEQQNLCVSYAYIASGTFSVITRRVLLMEDTKA